MKKRGTVTFTFDDGYQKVFETVPALLEKYNFKGVFAVTLNHQKLEQTENAKVTPWQDWLEIKKRGHEIAAHSINHVNLTQLLREELEKELREPHEKLGATTLVYPGGGFDDQVALTAMEYYTAARTVVRGFESLPTKRPMNLQSYNWIKNNFSSSKANLLALWAHLTGSWLIETFHMVSDSDEKMVHTVKSSALDKHLHFVSKLPVYVRTIQEVISGYHNQERRG